MFEKASRKKLRVLTSKGSVSVEDLWDLPLIDPHGGLSLDNIARTFNKALKENEDESFVLKAVEPDTNLKLGFDITMHIIKVKLAEAEKAKMAAITRDKKQQILAAISNKKADEINTATLEELQEMLEDL